MPTKPLSILFIGDIVGKIGRRVVQEILPGWMKEYSPDIVIGNVENISHGKGVVASHLVDMKVAGVTAFTGGNHVWQKADPASDEIRGIAPFALPANDAKTIPPMRVQVIDVEGIPLVFMNLLGTFQMPGGEKLANPFKVFDELYTGLKQPKFLFVDFHAEATSEKNAFGFYADGRASVVVGTHTHIPTADERILKNGTGYITDVGMTGSNESVLGVAKETIIQRFLGGEKLTFDYPENGEGWINAIFCELDSNTGKCATLKRLQKTLTIN